MKTITLQHLDNLLAKPAFVREATAKQQFTMACESLPQDMGRIAKFDAALEICGFYYGCPESNEILDAWAEFLTCNNIVS